MTVDIKLGVVGLGHWGPNLLRNFDNLGALAAYCDTDPARRETFAGKYPDVQGFDSMEALLDSPDVEAVAIATPAATHGALVGQALSAGKHVLAEKPLCLDLEEAKRLKETADGKGLVLMVGHVLLYHPAFIALKELVQEGELGDIHYIYSNRASLGKIRREENALWSFAPHDVSMILQLTGRLPEWITATGAHYLTEGVADTSLSYLKFSKNLQAHIYVSWQHPFKEQRLVVVGEKAMAVFDDTQPAPDKLLLYRHALGWDGDIPVVSKAKPEAVPVIEGEPLARECEAFLDAVRGNTAPPSDAGEGIRVLEVLVACQEAMTSGARVQLKTEAAP